MKAHMDVEQEIFVDDCVCMLITKRAVRGTETRRQRGIVCYGSRLDTKRSGNLM